MKRKTPGLGMSERSAVSKKISVALPNEVMDQVASIARQNGVGTAAIIRDAVRQWLDVRGFQEDRP